MEKYTLVEKSYRIDFSKIDEGYLASDTICHADSLGKAKSKLLDEIKYDGWKLRTGEEVSFVNIPVVRSKETDLYEFEGEKISIYKINEILNERERQLELDKMLSNESIKFCYIRKGSYYMPNSCGYTQFRHKAGVYEKADAVSHARSCRELTIIPINIEEHNKAINEEINDLKTRLIVW